MATFISPQQLKDKLTRQEVLYLLDIRHNQNFLSWHIPGSVNIPWERFSDSINSIPKNKIVITICNRGNDSQLAADYLVKNGFKASVLRGGWKVWNNIYDISPGNIHDTSSLQVYQIKRLGKGCLSYLLVAGNKAIVIDPARHIDVFINFIKKKKLQLIAVIDTHIHADHLSGGLTLSREYAVDYFLPEKSEVEFGFKKLEEIRKSLKELNIRIILTPGHTVESVCLLLDDKYLFTGDTLFFKSVGRSDLGQELAQNARLLYESIKDKIFRLDDSVIILPAHNQQPMRPNEPPITSTLGKVKLQNDISKFKTSADLVKAFKDADIPTPANFLKIKKLNQTGKIPAEDLDELEFGANRCAVKV